MTIAAVAPDRLSGVFFNDVGPELDLDGLKFIADYVGRAPAAKTHAEMAAGLAKLNEGVVEGLTLADWETVSRRTYVEDSNGLKLRYDPGWRESVLAAVSTIEAAGGSAELWPFYESLAHVPVAVLRGANSNILSHATLKDMAARHPDCQIAEVPGRGHVPFLDEAESLSLFDHWLERVRA
jgi:pimeloyl-ACP methyl ester carboxylesterase